jgi:nucleoside-diphosphate-sugar epimerase
MNDAAVTLVTGASGFVGRALLSELSLGRERIIAVSRREQPPLAGVEWVRGDLADAGFVDELFARYRPATVFHLASWVSGRREREYVRTALQANLVPAVHILVASAGYPVRRIVVAGSMEEPNLTEGEVASSPYAAAKACQTVYARFFHALYRIPVVIARIFMAYGPGQQDPTKLVPYAIGENLAGRPAKLASGTRPVDWIFVEDVARGLVVLSRAPGIEGEMLDLGSGTAVTTGAVATEIAARLNAPPPELRVVPDRPLETVRRADVERTAARTGFRPQVSLGEGLERTIAYYRSQLARSSS